MARRRRSKSSKKSTVRKVTRSPLNTKRDTTISIQSGIDRPQGQKSKDTTLPGGKSKVISQTGAHSRLSPQGVVHVKSYMKGVWRRFGDTAGPARPNTSIRPNVPRISTVSTDPLPTKEGETTQPRDLFSDVERWVGSENHGLLNAQLINNTAALHHTDSTSDVKRHVDVINSVIISQAQRVNASGNYALSTWMESRSRQLHMDTHRLLNDPNDAEAIRKTREEVDRVTTELTEILMLYDGVTSIDSRIGMELQRNPTSTRDYIATATAAGHIEIVMAMENLLNLHDTGSTLAVKNALIELSGQLSSKNLVSLQRQADTISVDNRANFIRDLTDLVNNHDDIIRPKREDIEAEVDYGNGGWEDYNTQMGEKADSRTRSELVGSSVASFNSMSENIRALSASRHMSPSSVESGMVFHLARMMADNEISSATVEKIEGDSSLSDAANDAALTQERLREVIVGMLVDSNISALTERLPLLVWAHHLSSGDNNRNGLAEVNRRLEDEKALLTAPELKKYQEAVRWMKEGSSELKALVAGIDPDMKRFDGLSVNSILSDLTGGIKTKELVDGIMRVKATQYAKTINKAFDDLFSGMTALQQAGSPTHGERTRLMSEFASALPHNFMQKSRDNESFALLNELAPHIPDSFVDKKDMIFFTASLNNAVFNAARADSNITDPVAATDLGYGHLRGYRSLFLNESGYSHTKGLEIERLYEDGTTGSDILGTLREVINNAKELQTYPGDSADRMVEQTESIIKNHYNVIRFDRSRHITETSSKDLDHFRHQARENSRLLEDFTGTAMAYLDKIGDSGDTTSQAIGLSAVRDILTRLKSMESTEQMNILLSKDMVQDVSVMHSDNTRWLRTELSRVDEYFDKKTTDKFAKLVWSVTALQDKTRTYDGRNEGIRGLIVDALSGHDFTSDTQGLQEKIKKADEKESVDLYGNTNREDSIETHLDNQPELHLLDPTSDAANIIRDKFVLDQADMDSIHRDIIQTQDSWNKLNAMIHLKAKDQSDYVLLTQHEIPNNDNMILMGKGKDRLIIKRGNLTTSARKYIKTEYGTGRLSNTALQGSEFDRIILTDTSIDRVLHTLDGMQLAGSTTINLDGSAVLLRNNLIDALMTGGSSDIRLAQNALIHLFKTLRQTKDLAKPLADTSNQLADLHPELDALMAARIKETNKDTDVADKNYPHLLEQAKIALTDTLRMIDQLDLNNLSDDARSELEKTIIKTAFQVGNVINPHGYIVDAVNTGNIDKDLKVLTELLPSFVNYLDNIAPRVRRRVEAEAKTDLDTMSASEQELLKTRLTANIKHKSRARFKPSKDKDLSPKVKQAMTKILEGLGFDVNNTNIYAAYIETRPADLGLTMMHPRQSVLGIMKKLGVEPQSTANTESRTALVHAIANEFKISRRAVLDKGDRTDIDQKTVTDVLSILGFEVDAKAISAAHRVLQADSKWKTLFTDIQGELKGELGEGLVKTVMGLDSNIHQTNLRNVLDSLQNLIAPIESLGEAQEKTVQQIFTDHAEIFGRLEGMGYRAQSSDDSKLSLLIDSKSALDGANTDASVIQGALRSAKSAQSSLVRRAANDDILVHTSEQRRWENAGYVNDRGYLGAEDKNRYMDAINFRGSSLAPSSKEGVSTPWDTNKSLQLVHRISKDLDTMTNVIAETETKYGDLDIDPAREALSRAHAELNGYTSIVYGPDANTGLAFVKSADGNMELIGSHEVRSNDKIFSHSNGLPNNNPYLSGGLKRREYSLRQALMRVATEINKVTNDVHEKFIDGEFGEYTTFAKSVNPLSSLHQRSAISNLLVKAQQAFMYKWKMLNKDQIYVNDGVVDRESVLASNITRLHRLISFNSQKIETSFYNDKLWQDDLSASLVNGKVSDQVKALLQIGGNDFDSIALHSLEVNKQQELIAVADHYTELVRLAEADNRTDEATVLRDLANVEAPKIDPNSVPTARELRIAMERIVDLAFKYKGDVVEKGPQRIQNIKPILSVIKQSLDDILQGTDEGDMYAPLVSEHADLLKNLQARVDLANVPLQDRGDKFNPELSRLVDNQLEIQGFTQQEIDKIKLGRAPELGSRRLDADAEMKELLRSVGFDQDGIAQLDSDKPVDTPVGNRLDAVIASINLADKFSDRVVKDEQFNNILDEMLVSSEASNKSPRLLLEAASRERISLEQTEVGADVPQRTKAIQDRFTGQPDVSTVLRDILDNGISAEEGSVGYISNQDRHVLLAAINNDMTARTESLGITESGVIPRGKEAQAKTLTQDMQRVSQMLQKVGIVKGALQEDIKGRTIEGAEQVTRYISLDAETREVPGVVKEKLIEELGGDPIDFYKSGYNQILTVTGYDSGDNKMHYYTEHGDARADDGTIILTNQEILEKTGLKLESLMDLQQRLHSVNDENGVLLAHNGDGYDIPVLIGAGIDVPSSLRSIDTMTMISDKTGTHRVALDNVAQATVNKGKTNKGAAVAQIWSKLISSEPGSDRAVRELEGLLKYNAQDSAITRDVYLEAQKTGTVLVYADGTPSSPMRERGADINMILPDMPLTGSTYDQLKRARDSFSNQIRRLHTVDVINPKVLSGDTTPEDSRGVEKMEVYDLNSVNKKAYVSDVRSSWETMIKNYYEMNNLGIPPDSLLKSNMIDKAFMNSVADSALSVMSDKTHSDPNLAKLSDHMRSLDSDQSALVNNILNDPFLDVNKLNKDMQETSIRELLDAVETSLNMERNTLDNSDVYTAKWLLDHREVVAGLINTTDSALSLTLDSNPALKKELTSVLNGERESLSTKLDDVLRHNNIREASKTLITHQDATLNLSDQGRDVLRSYALGNINRRDAETRLNEVTAVRDDSLMLAMKVADGLAEGVSSDSMSNLTQSFLRGATAFQIAGVLIKDSMSVGGRVQTAGGVNTALKQLNIGSSLVDVVNSIRTNPDAIRPSLQEAIIKIHKIKFSDDKITTNEDREVASMEPDNRLENPQLDRMTAALMALGADAGYISGLDVNRANQLDQVFTLNLGSQMSATTVGHNMQQLSTLKTDRDNGSKTEHEIDAAVDMTLNMIYDSATVIKINKQSDMQLVLDTLIDKLPGVDNTIRLISDQADYKVLEVSYDDVNKADESIVIHSIDVGEPRHLTERLTESVWDTYQRYAAGKRLDASVTKDSLLQHKNTGKIRQKASKEGSLVAKDFIPSRTEMEIMVNKLRKASGWFQPKGKSTLAVGNRNLETFVRDIVHLKPEAKISIDQAETLVALRELFGGDKVGLDAMPALIKNMQMVTASLSMSLNEKLKTMPNGDSILNNWSATDAYRLSLDIAKDPSVQERVKESYALLHKINEMKVYATQEYGSVVEDTPILLLAEALTHSLNSVVNLVDARVISRRLLDEEVTGKRSIESLDILRTNTRENYGGKYTSMPHNFMLREHAPKESFDDPDSAYNIKAMENMIKQNETSVTQLMETNSGLTHSATRGDISAVADMLAHTMPSMLASAEASLQHLYKYAQDAQYDPTDLAMGTNFLTWVGFLASSNSAEGNNANTYVRSNPYKKEQPDLYGFDKDGKEYNKLDYSIYDGTGESAVQNSLQERPSVPSSVPRPFDQYSYGQMAGNRLKNRDIYSVAPYVVQLFKSDHNGRLSTFASEHIPHRDQIYAAQRIINRGSDGSGESGSIVHILKEGLLAKNELLSEKNLRDYEEKDREGYEENFINDTPWNKFVETVLIAGVAHTNNFKTSRRREMEVELLASAEIRHGPDKDANYFREIISAYEDNYGPRMVNADRNDKGLMNTYAWAVRSLDKLEGTKTTPNFDFMTPSNDIPEPNFAQNQYTKKLESDANNWDGVSIDNNYWSKRQLESMTNIDNLKDYRSIEVRKNEDILAKSSSATRRKEAHDILLEMTGVEYPSDFAEQYAVKLVEVSPETAGTDQYYDPSLTVSPQIDALRLIAGSAMSGKVNPAEFLTGLYIMGDMLDLKKTLYPFQRMNRKHDNPVIGLEQKLNPEVQADGTLSRDVAARYETLQQVAPKLSLDIQDPFLKAMEDGNIIDHTFEGGQWKIKYRTTPGGPEKTAVGNPNHMIYNAPDLTPHEVIVNNEMVDAGEKTGYAYVHVEHILAGGFRPAVADTQIESLAKRMVNEVVQDWKENTQEYNPLMSTDNETLPYTITLGETTEARDVPPDRRDLMNLLDRAQFPQIEIADVYAQNEKLETYDAFRTAFDDAITNIDKKYKGLIDIADPMSPLYAGPTEALHEGPDGRPTEESALSYIRETTAFQEEFKRISNFLDRAVRPVPILSDGSNLRIAMPPLDKNDPLAVAYHDAFKREMTKKVNKENGAAGDTPIVSLQIIDKPPAVGRQTQLLKDMKEHSRVVNSVLEKSDANLEREMLGNTQLADQIATALQNTELVATPTQNVAATEHTLSNEDPAVHRYSTPNGNDVGVTLYVSVTENGHSGSFGYIRPGQEKGTHVLDTQRIMEDFGINRILDGLPESKRGDIQMDIGVSEAQGMRIDMQYGDDADSDTQYSVTTKLNKDHVAVKLHTLILPAANAEGQGIGTETVGKMIQSNFRLANEQGKKHVALNLHADLATGGYVWGDAGWRVIGDTSRQQIVDGFVADMRRLEDKYGVEEIPIGMSTEDVQQRVRESLNLFTETGSMSHLSDAFGEQTSLMDPEKLESDFGDLPRIFSSLMAKNSYNALLRLSTNETTLTASPEFQDFQKRYRRKVGRPFNING